MASTRAHETITVRSDANTPTSTPGPPSKPELPPSKTSACKQCRKKKIKCEPSGSVPACKKCVKGKYICEPGGPNMRWHCSKTRSKRTGIAQLSRQRGRRKAAEQRRVSRISSRESPADSAGRSASAVTMDLLPATGTPTSTRPLGDMMIASLRSKISVTDASHLFGVFRDHRNQMIGVVYLAPSTESVQFSTEQPVLFATIVAVQSQREDLIQDLVQLLHNYILLQFEILTVEILQSLVVMVVYNSAHVLYVVKRLPLLLSMCRITGEQILHINGQTDLSMMPPPYLRAWLSLFLVNQWYVPPLCARSGPVTHHDDSVVLLDPRAPHATALTIPDLDRCQSSLQRHGDAPTDQLLCDVVRLRLTPQTTGSSLPEHSLFSGDDGRTSIYAFYTALFKVLDAQSPHHSRLVLEPDSDWPATITTSDRSPSYTLLYAFCHLTPSMIVDLPELLGMSVADAITSVFINYDPPSPDPEEQLRLCQRLLDKLGSISENGHPFQKLLTETLRQWKRSTDILPRRFTSFQNMFPTVDGSDFAQLIG